MLAPVFTAARQLVREGVREIDIDAELIGVGRKAGHLGIQRMRGFNQELPTIAVQAGFTGAISTYADAPIAGAGLSPAFPIGASLKKVERGVPVTVDYGGAYNGYITDETRVFVVGPLNEHFQKPYECTVEIFEDIMAHAKEGVDCTEIFARAHQIVKKFGLEENFMGSGSGQVSFIGHGIGLEINELPVITARYSTILKTGMVFSLEPKFVFPGRGAIGMEVDFIVQPDRLERVTSDSFELVTL
jgi:Xaa-Pro aminopeptidase